MVRKHVVEFSTEAKNVQLLRKGFKADIDYELARPVGLASGTTAFEKLVVEVDGEATRIYRSDTRDSSTSQAFFAPLLMPMCVYGVVVRTEKKIRNIEIEDVNWIW